MRDRHPPATRTACLAFVSLVCAWLLVRVASGSHSAPALPPAPRPPAVVANSRPTPPLSVVVLAIDGVRWQDVFPVAPGSAGRVPQLRGEEVTPNLHRLARTEGVLVGADASPMLVSNRSTVSLPGYSEIFSGHPPSCSSNECPATSEPTLLDDWLQRDPSTGIAIISSWSRIPRVAARDLSRMTVSAGQSVHVHEEQFCTRAELCLRYRAGIHTDTWPGTDDYRPDRETAALALEYLRVHEPQFLFVGLGDTDEHAHHGDFAAYLGALRAADATLAALGTWLEGKRRQGHRTLLVCTTDHGRAQGFAHHANAPEAARVWALFAGSVVTARGQLVGSGARLADIAPTIRELLFFPDVTRADAGKSLLPALARDQPEFAMARFTSTHRHQR